MKPVNKATVSRVLSAARHTKSEAQSTRVRGYRPDSTGFKTFTGNNGSVEVHLVTSLFFHNEVARNGFTLERFLSSWTSTLQKSGFVVENNGKFVHVLGRN
jgi:hypothetical protein